MERWCSTWVLRMGWLSKMRWSGFGSPSRCRSPLSRRKSAPKIRCLNHIGMGGDSSANTSAGFPKMCFGMKW